MKPEADESIMIRFQAGDRGAFSELVRRHQGPLFGFVCRQLQVRSVAEEVVQEAFVRVVQSAADFKQDSRFTTWIYAIARNLCIDQLRRNTHRRHPSLDAPGRHEGPTLGERVSDERANVEREATGTELQIRIAAAVDRLPEEQREVFLLRECSNLPFKEIAEITRVSENTVKSRMRYALERLQTELSEYEEYARALR